jgi:hypothetical protein
MMTMSKNNVFSAAVIKELVRHGESIEGIQTLGMVGLLDWPVADRLLQFKRHWEPPEGADTIHYADEHPKYERILTRNANKNINKAVRSGDEAVLQFIRGLDTDDDPDGFGGDYMKMKSMESYVDEDGRLVAWGGRMGGGKSNGAIRFTQFFHTIRPNSRLIHNIPTLRAPEGVDMVYVDGTSALKEAIAEGDEEDIDMQVLLDEMSTHGASGYGHDSTKVVQEIAGLITLMRHRGVRFMQVIGHRVQADLHPSIRSLADIILKPDKYTAEVYDAINESGNGVDMKFDFSLDDCQDGTGWRYDDKEDTEWTWECDEESVDWEEEKRRLAAMVYITTPGGNEPGGLGYRDVGDIFEMSKSAVERAVKGME